MFSNKDNFPATESRDTRVTNNNEQFPFLTVIIKHTLGLIVGNVESLQNAEHSGHGRLSGLICFDRLVMFEQLFKFLDGHILSVSLYSRETEPQI